MNTRKTLDSELLHSTSCRTSDNDRPEPADSSIQVTANHSFADEARFRRFGSQLSATSDTREIAESDCGSVHESIVSAKVDNAAQDSSISNTGNEEKR